jgi:hypothetical protein
LPPNLCRESLETVRNQLIYQGANLIPKANQKWTVVMNRQYQYITEAKHIRDKVMQMAYFIDYAEQLYKCAILKNCN